MGDVTPVPNPRHAGFSPLRRVNDLPSSNPKPRSTSKRHECRAPSHPPTVPSPQRCRVRLAPQSIIVPTWVPQRRTSVEFSKPSVVEFLAPLGVGRGRTSRAARSQRRVQRRNVLGSGVRPGQPCRLRRAGRVGRSATNATKGGRAVRAARDRIISPFFIQIVVDVQAEVMHDCVHGRLGSLYGVQ